MLAQALGLWIVTRAVGNAAAEQAVHDEVLRMQVMESLRSPELKGRGLSHHLHYFIEKMMAKNLEARYQSWDELIGDIRTQIEGRDSLDFTKETPRRAGPGTPPGRR